MASPPEPSPERPVQLRNDLNDLYVLVGDLQTTVQGIATTQQDHGVRLVRVERGVTELRTDVTGLRGDMAELRGEVAELRSGFGELRKGQAELCVDVAELRQGQAEILRILRGRA